MAGQDAKQKTSELKKKNFGDSVYILRMQGLELQNCLGRGVWCEGRDPVNIVGSQLENPWGTLPV